MKRLQRSLTLALLIVIAAGCPEMQEESPVGDLALAQSEADRPPTLHYFTTSARGTHSVLWRAETTGTPSASGTLPRQRLALVEHAPGYAPRGAASKSGRLGWLTLPGDRRHSNPAQLWLDGELVDDRALYLQTPLFIDERFFYLRREPGPERIGDDGRLLQTMDDFELVRIDPDGKEDIVHSETALWVHFIGQLPGTPDRFLVQRVRDDGSHLLVFELGGRLLSTHFLGTGAIRDVQVDPRRGHWISYLESQSGTGGSRVLKLDLDAPLNGRHGQSSARVIHDKLPPHAAPLPLRSGDLLFSQGNPAAGPFFVPLLEVSKGRVLWREHTKGSLTYMLRTPDKRGVRLVPPGDAAQDVSLLRGPR